MKTIVMGYNKATYHTKSLTHYLQQQNYQVLEVCLRSELLNLIKNNTRIVSVLLNMDFFNDDFFSQELVKKINMINENLPIFLLKNSENDEELDFESLENSVQYVESNLYSEQDILHKIEKAVENYLNKITPPLTKALFRYVDESKYTFCTPGHMGGTAFQKSPIGTIFYDFFGENTLKSDISISVGELGSLLDHSGPHAEAEKYIAKTFNADRSYIITNGTSTANKVVGMYSVPAGKTVLIDRNCHKSLTHLLMMSDIVPIYFKPTRNAYGLLGGIPQSEFTDDVIKQKIATTKNASWPVHAVITNSTYDGLFYNTDKIKRNLNVKSIHFDSAWVPYTNFSPIYRGKTGMGGVQLPNKVIYETQSTHKLLAAFSQASMIHIKGKIDEDVFNEAYMMHTSTSPNYGIVASTEVAAAMMNDNMGKRLIQDSIERAVKLRKLIRQSYLASDDWYFNVWQPENIDCTECWELEPNQSWHGFKHIDSEHMYLDPIKVTLLTPGLSKEGQLQETGIPAVLVSKFLDSKGIIIEKTGPYNLLVLISIGVDDTKAISLVQGLNEFKALYDQNVLVKDILPEVYAESPGFYENMGIQALAQGIHQLIYKHNLPELMYKAFDILPKMVMTPNKAFQLELNGSVQDCYIEDMIGKINANMILPYPPGVPLVMPGEMITEESRPILEFLLMLCEIGTHYPGFATDIHGAYKQDDGRYKVKIIVE
ncbi:lysine decarboxylase LdcC [Rodentibacter genomosp. 2]|uniref:Lysine decarboxylase LdcC n=1 Tax=Rodentibacter genomosp. 2 TaxID=1908266 RepID=A0A1V3JJP5_9PAST|nr:lysine decarboxylase LdcC [Rodentibacter genomosp. 2]OOF56637.1 lysine decarboxylase LdcC [Rodentibacter genomosp. 2]